MPDALGRRLWSRLLRMAPAGISAGVHRLARVGAGFDLAGIRPFEPGDDPRRLDAGATARRGFPHVRDDRPAPSQALHFVVEGGARLLASPPPTPFDVAQEVISLLVPVALACGDPVGITRLDDKGFHHVPPRRDHAAGQECLKPLLTANSPSFGDHFDLWTNLVPRGALALILTDGLSRSLPAQLSALAQRAEVRLLLLRHPWIDGPAPDVGSIIDPVTNTVLPTPTATAWLAWRRGALEQIALTTAACRIHREVSCNKGATSLLGVLLADLLTGHGP